MICFYCTGVKVTVLKVTMVGNNEYPSKRELHSNGGNMALLYYTASDSFGNVIRIRESQFINGKAKLGAGICIDYLQTSDVENKNEVRISDSFFENNTAFVGSGAIYFQIDQGITNIFGKTVSLQIENCKFVEKTVSSALDTGIAINILYF